MADGTSFWKVFFGVLAALAVASSCIVGGCVMLAGYSAIKVAEGIASPGAPASGEPVVELLSFRWQQSPGGSLVVAEGEVRNISSAPLEGVRAAVVFTTASNQLITSANSRLEYSPILPGQTSPFKVVANWNPEMKQARLDFTRGGTALAWRQGK